MTPSEKQLINLTDQTTSLTSPRGMVDFASTLKEVIIAQNLYTNIKGKNYVHVEAWQFAGAAMGVIAIVKSTERVLTNNTGEVNYRAEVELRRLENDQLVGSGIAFCSNKEYSKKQFDEYAIASMAQTRATSKAYRIAFGWLMKMAGYEATPHEEMDGIGEKEVVRPIVDIPDPLTEAKTELNDLFESKGTKTAPAKKAYIVAVIGKSTIETVAEADEVIRELREGK